MVTARQRHRPEARQQPHDAEAVVHCALGLRQHRRHELHGGTAHSHSDVIVAFIHMYA